MTIRINRDLSNLHEFSTYKKNRERKDVPVTVSVSLQEAAIAKLIGQAEEHALSTGTNAAVALQKVCQMTRNADLMAVWLATPAGPREADAALSSEG